MELLKSDAQFVCFAPIDLKLADFYVYDGFSVDGVTNSALEPSSETSIALADCDESVPVGATVHFGNDSTDTEYVVTARSTSGGTNAIFQIDLDSSSSGNFTLTYNGQTTNNIAYNAAVALIQLELEALDGIGNGDVLVEAGTGGYDIDITFQDDLAATPISDTVFTFDKGTLDGSAPVMALTTPGVVDGTTDTITISPGLAEQIAADGTVTFTGRRLEIKIGEGNLTYDESVTREYLLNRGVLDTVRNGDEVPVEVSFDFIWEFITGVTSSSLPTLEDVLKQRGEASAWESTSSDACEPYCVDIVIKYDPGCGGANTETITLPYFRYETLSHDIRESQISCTGKCNAVEATAVRGS